VAHRPIVTVLVPARNEERDIERCLAAIAAQDYPLEQLEIIVVDGASTDRTHEVAAAALADVPFARTKVLTNPNGSTPSNLNLGLTVAQGEVLCRVDARSIIPPHYVSTCVEVLNTRPDVAVVGGAQVAVAPRRDAVGTGIARALNNKWGMGLSRYRRAARSGAADTVYLGAFRTPELRGARGWDEAFHTNQDFELNRRMGRTGTVWFDERLEVAYVPRSSLADLYSQYHRFGRWKVRYWRTTGDRPQPRQLVLLAAPPVAVIAGIAALRATRGRSRLALVAAAAAAATAFELAGSTGPDGGAGSRAVSLAASAAVGAGWSSGVARELATRPR
jgi:glycosyltransferase involved in cell wall biosynthesis